jgi:hypothetical protein
MGYAGRSAWPVGAHAGAWASGAAGIVGSGVGASVWELGAWLPPGWSAVGSRRRTREQGQAQVADLGQQAVQGRLVGDRPGDDGLPAWSLLSCRPSNQADQRASSTPWTRSS